MSEILIGGALMVVGLLLLLLAAFTLGKRADDELDDLVRRLEEEDAYERRFDHDR